MSKKTYIVSMVVKNTYGGSGYNIMLRDPDVLDDEGFHKYAGGFSFVGELAIPPIEGGTVEVTGVLGTRDCIIEWDRGRFVKLKYEPKESS